MNQHSSDKLRLRKLRAKYRKLMWIAGGIFLILGLAGGIFVGKMLLEGKGYLPSNSMQPKSMTTAAPESSNVILSAEPTALPSAPAEGFTVRNGIMFGMSIQEVIDFELNTNGVIVSARENDNGTIKYYESDFINIAGYNNSLITYEFDDNGSLCGIEYWIGTISEYKYVNDLAVAYDTIEASLEKYDEISLNVLDGLDGGTMDVYVDMYDLIDGTSKNAVQCGKSERLAVFDDDYVLIQHVSMLAGNLPNHHVSYRLQDNALVNKIYQDFSDAQNYKQNSLDNDF